jgi:murein DD-endopeptidase MepM/ murein hydrolase activator NlpD
VAALLGVALLSALDPASASGPAARFDRLAPDSAVRFEWPVVAAGVMRRFDPPPRPWLAGHRGVDLAAAPGTPVRAAGTGTIVFAGVVAGRGVVSIAHPGGLRTTYEPVTVGDLRPGQPVPAGGRIGTLDRGHPGCPAPACLHWGLRRGGEYLDPLTLFGLGRVRLRPP